VIKAEWFYWLIAAFFLAVGFMVMRDRTNPKRFPSGAFWGLLGICFPYSGFVTGGSAPAWPLGIAVIVIAVLAGTGQLRSGTAEHSTSPEEREGLAARFGNKLFIPVLAIPVITGLFAAVGPNLSIGGKPVLEPGNETVIGLGASAVIAVVIGMWILRTRKPSVPLHEGRRLTENVGWAAVLPQLLSMLGLVFATAGVGKAIGNSAGQILPRGSLLAAVVVYCLGMTIFTIIMGNAFAAFPVMTAAIGYPLLIQQFHGNAGLVFAVGMLAGYCGTLCTPMAANFNIVPVALLGLKSDYSVIRAQIPTALPLWVCNVAIVYFLAFRSS
jgi:uncharacterized membrane protein